MQKKADPKTTSAPVRLRRKSANGDLSEKLIEAAIELFWKKGFADTNTRDIAIACEVSPGAMYFHYKSKSELLFRVLSVTHTRLQKYYLDAIANAGPEPSDQLYAWVRTSAWFHAEHRKQAVVTHREFKFLEAPSLDQIKSLRRDMEHALEVVIQRGIDSGKFKIVGKPSRPARQLTIAIGNMCNQIAEWYVPSNDLTPEAIGEFYANLALLMAQAKRKRA
jgi:AcrR family transcriptional regulator